MLSANLNSSHLPSLNSIDKKLLPPKSTKILWSNALIFTHLQIYQMTNLCVVGAISWIKSENNASFYVISEGDLFLQHFLTRFEFILPLQTLFFPSLKHQFLIFLKIVSLKSSHFSIYDCLFSIRLGIFNTILSLFSVIWSLVLQQIAILVKSRVFAQLCLQPFFKVFVNFPFLYFLFEQLQRFFVVLSVKLRLNLCFNS